VSGDVNLVDLVTDELASVRGELVRVDAKAGSLLGLAAAVLALLAARTTGAALPPAVAVATWAAAATFAAAVALLLLVVGPRLVRPPWTSYIGRTADDVLEQLQVRAGSGPAAWRAGRLAELAPIIASKYRRLWWAVRLLLAGLVLLGVAAVLQAVTL
jgi:Pycsar effector protein